MRGFIDFLVSTFGYLNVVHFKDTILFLSGILSGAVVMLLFLGNFFHKLRKSKISCELVSVKVDYKNSSYYITNPKNFAEAVELMLTMSFLFLLRRDKTYLLRNTLRTNVVYHISMIVVIACVILGVLFINNTILPPETLKAMKH